MIHVNTSQSDKGIIEVKVVGKLHKEDLLQTLEPALDEMIGKQESITGLMIDATEFDGWDGLSTIMTHMGVVRRHHRFIKRIAVCGNRSWQKMLPRFSNVFLKSELKFFGGEDAQPDARNWLEDLPGEPQTATEKESSPTHSQEESERHEYKE